MFQRKAKAASSFHIKAPTTSEKRKKLRSKKRHDTRRAATAASRRTESDHRGQDAAAEKCEYCDYVTSDESLLLSHMFRCPLAGPDCHRCDKCSYATPWLRLYHEHMCTHFKGPPFT